MIFAVSGHLIQVESRTKRLPTGEGCSGIGFNETRKVTTGRGGQSKNDHRIFFFLHFGPADWLKADEQPIRGTEDEKITKTPQSYSHGVFSPSLSRKSTASSFGAQKPEPDCAPSLFEFPFARGYAKVKARCTLLAPAFIPPRLQAVRLLVLTLERTTLSCLNSFLSFSSISPSYCQPPLPRRDVYPDNLGESTHFYRFMGREFTVVLIQANDG